MCSVTGLLLPEVLSGHSPKEVMFGAFPENDHRCVVNCLRQYESVTQQHRKKESGMPQPLFLSYIKPHVQ